MTTSDKRCTVCNLEKSTICSECYSKWISEEAKLTVLEHLFAALMCLLVFEFNGLFLELSWSLERLLKVGDYSPGGYFDQLNIDWEYTLE